jgi:hypothetical protein
VVKYGIARWLSTPNLKVNAAKLGTSADFEHGIAPTPFSSTDSPGSRESS